MTCGDRGRAALSFMLGEHIELRRSRRSLSTVVYIPCESEHGTYATASVPCGRWHARSMPGEQTYAAPLTLREPRPPEIDGLPCLLAWSGMP